MEEEEKLKIFKGFRVSSPVRRRFESFRFFERRLVGLFESSDSMRVSGFALILMFSFGISTAGGKSMTIRSLHLSDVVSLTEKKERHRFRKRRKL